jgi:hypothetical protein
MRKNGYSKLMNIAVWLIFPLNQPMLFSVEAAPFRERDIEFHDARIASTGAIRAARIAGARAAPWLNSINITTPTRT